MRLFTILDGIEKKLMAREPKIATLNVPRGIYNAGTFFAATITKDEIGISHWAGLITIPAGRYRITAGITADSKGAGRIWTELNIHTSENKTALVSSIIYGPFGTSNYDYIVDSDKAFKISISTREKTEVNGAGTGPSTIQIQKLK